MADEGASSSSNSVDEIEEKKESQTPQFVSNFNSNASDSCSTAVSSSGHMACGGNQVFLLGKEGGNPATNPFAIKTTAPTRSVADSTESKESRPLLAPPTLKLGIPETPKIVLRASALSVQAEKLKLMNKHEGNATKQEGKENSSDESNMAKIPRLEATETNGKLSKGESFVSGITTSSSEVTTMSSPSKSVAENTFSLAAKNLDDQSSKSNGGNFIFGQNLHERALNYDNQNERPSSPTDSHNLTFEEAALKKEELEKMERDNQEEKLKKSLSESAKEYESKQVKRKFDEVTVVTGEEEESNVLQINCKLFAYDKVGMNWQERGRGLLRLNDKDCRGTLNSRVVMRTTGSLRVVLNTKVWAGMSVEHPSKKTVRLTAYDPQGVKLYLVMAQPKDAEQLFHALDCRVATLKGQDNRQTSSSTVEEATSSSTSPNECAKDNSPPAKRLETSETGGAADSSSETHFVLRVTEDGSSVVGTADSTAVQS
ncbi:hypothetical protein JTE90_004280 [Oedothorax gibbosus]|uniref:RanBD1 domain-containing protein n=1 Tax=Oedothorax gibbosus TaxID=931172 RepID=A0AAV6VJL2_9ARAC|nr:hypothetical protein JTE90_004280 [Oedothorax gibbosus]